MIDPYYQDDLITIYHADCMVILQTLESRSIDLLLVDPPYGIDISNKNLGAGRTTIAPSSPMQYGTWDTERLPKTTIDEMRRISKKQILWGGNYYADILPPTMGWLVWDKRGDLPQRSYADVELAWTSEQMAARKRTHRWDGFIRDGKEKRNGHPTQKPVALMQWCISLMKGTKSVIDPCMGGGSTLRACKNLGISCIGVDNDERYCEIAASMLQQECFVF